MLLARLQATPVPAATSNSYVKGAPAHSVLSSQRAPGDALRPGNVRGDKQIMHRVGVSA
jgi:hypothetical protein